MAVVAAVSIAGCVPGLTGSPVTKAELIRTLSTDPSLTVVRTATGSTAFGAFLDCVADYLIRKARADDLRAYIRGDRTLSAVRGFDTAANADVVGRNCAASAVRGAPTPSAAPS
jgi:hypothetical protein